METRRHGDVSDLDDPQLIRPDGARVAALAADIAAYLAFADLPDPSRVAAASGITPLARRQWFWYAATTRPVRDGEEWIGRLGVNAIQHMWGFARSRRAASRAADAAIVGMVGALVAVDGAQ